MYEDLVSVIITTYNSNEVFLKNAIESVLGQTYENIEVIIIDDGSTNNISKEICEKYKYKIQYYYQENKGLAGARNTGIIKSKGKYIAFLDDDDIWIEEKISKQIDRIKEVERRDSNVGLTFTYSIVIDEYDNYISKYGYKVEGYIFEKILGRNIIGAPSSVLIKRNVLEDVGLFNEEFRYAEDIELWYRITKRYSVYSTNDYLIKYRFRENSLSKNIEKMYYYTEAALLKIMQSEKNNINIQNKRREIYDRFYLNTAYSFFSANNKVMYDKIFKILIKNNIRNIFNKKLVLGYVISIFGNGFLNELNKIRKKNKIPKAMMSIQDFTKVDK